MKKGKGKEKAPVIAAMAFFLISGAAACIAKPYLPGQEERLTPVYVRGEAAEPSGAEEQPEATATPAPEEQKEPEATATPEPEKKLYTFQVQKGISGLNVREAPGMEAAIIGLLKPGETGDVLEPGEEWSLVTTGKKTGYVSNQYITMQEKP